MSARDVIAGSLACQKDAALFVAHADRIVTALTAAGYSIVHRDENHGPTVDRFRQEIARLLPHYQSQTATDAGRRQLLEHFETFALRALPDGGVDNG